MNGAPIPLVDADALEANYPGTELVVWTLIEGEDGTRTLIELTATVPVAN